MQSFARAVAITLIRLTMFYVFLISFRGALDVGATTITRNMEIATVQAIAALAQAEQNDLVAMAYGSGTVSFGPEYLIPKPFDPRLIVKIAPAVAKAAMDDGVATRPLIDLEAYKDTLQQFVYHSGSFMKPLFSIAKKRSVSASFMPKAKKSACYGQCK